MTAVEFPLGHVLSITTGALVADNRADGLYEILNYMTGDNLFTHALPRAADVCKPHLIAQHPLLADIDFPRYEFEHRNPNVSAERWCRGWVDDVAQVLGSRLPVEPLPPGVWASKDPFTELADIEARREV